MRLQERLQTFNAKRSALLDEIGEMDPAKLVARPLPGKWSILEIIEHLVLAEIAIFQRLPSQLRERKRRVRHRVSYAIVMMVLKFGVPVPVPSRAMIPQGDRRLGELRRLWEESQKWLLAYIGAFGFTIIGFNFLSALAARRNQPALAGALLLPFVVLTVVMASAVLGQAVGPAHRPWPQ